MGITCLASSRLVSSRIFITIQVPSLRDSSLPSAVRRCFVVSAGCAAAGGTARTHYKHERAAVECRFIEHVRRGVLNSYEWLHYTGLFFHIPFRFFYSLFCLLLLHPANEQDADDDDVDEIARHPHDQSAQLLIRRGGKPPYTRSLQVRRI